jgi:hypothetical protein
MPTPGCSPESRRGKLQGVATTRPAGLQPARVSVPAPVALAELDYRRTCFRIPLGHHLHIVPEALAGDPVVQLHLIRELGCDHLKR